MQDKTHCLVLVINKAILLSDENSKALLTYNFNLNQRNYGKFHCCS